MSDNVTKQNEKPASKPTAKHTKCSKKQKLNIRERRFIKFLSQGMSQKDAAIRAGYSPKTAESIASQKLKETKVFAAFTDILEKQGVTDDKLGMTIADGLEANKVISAMVVRGKPDSIADEQDGMADAHGMTKDFIEVPDWLARHKFVDTCLKVKGSYASDKIEHTGKDGGAIEHNMVVTVVKYGSQVQPKLGTDST